LNGPGEPVGVTDDDRPGQGDEVRPRLDDDLRADPGDVAEGDE
jgi:hypothetical protein